MAGNSKLAAVQLASALGELAAQVDADMPGKNSRSATFAATGKPCHPTVSYDWGKAAKKAQ